MTVINSNKYILSITKLTPTFPFKNYSKIILIDSVGNIFNQKSYYATGDLIIYSTLTVLNGDIMFTGFSEFSICESSYLAYRFDWYLSMHEA